jgi:hypothetical protein
VWQILCREQRMNMISLSFEQMLPHIMIATAAAGLFVLLGVLVFLSVLLENWHEARKKKALSQRKTMRQAKQAQAQDILPLLREDWNIGKSGQQPITQG